MSRCDNVCLARTAWWGCSYTGSHFLYAAFPIICLIPILIIWLLLLIKSPRCYLLAKQTATSESTITTQGYHLAHNVVEFAHFYDPFHMMKTWRRQVFIDRIKSDHRKATQVVGVFLLVTERDLMWDWWQAVIRRVGSMDRSSWSYLDFRLITLEYLAQEEGIHSWKLPFT